MQQNKSGLILAKEHELTNKRLAEKLPAPQAMEPKKAVVPIEIVKKLMMAGARVAFEQMLPVIDDLGEHAALGHHGRFSHGHGLPEGTAGTVRARDQKDLYVHGIQGPHVIVPPLVSAEDNPV